MRDLRPAGTYLLDRKQTGKLSTSPIPLVVKMGAITACLYVIGDDLV